MRTHLGKAPATYQVPATNLLEARDHGCETLAILHTQVNKFDPAERAALERLKETHLKAAKMIDWLLERDEQENRDHLQMFHEIHQLNRLLEVPAVTNESALTVASSQSA